MKIASARFEISNSTVFKCPETKMHEYAFIGRSNVGKSSLINMLTGKTNLARTSATPGKTMLINHFLVNEEWYIVDLPGYGYASRGMQQRNEISRIMNIISLTRNSHNITCLKSNLFITYPQHKFTITHINNSSSSG